VTQRVPATARRLAAGLLRAALPPVLMFLLFLLAWHLYAGGLRVGGRELLRPQPPYLVPPPLAVGAAARENLGTLLSATLLTAAGSLAGFALSLLVGTLVAFLFSQSVLIQRAAYPYAIFLQTVPIVAVAPLIILWFGHGFAGIAVTAFIVSLFPIVTNGTAGLTALDPSTAELFEVNNATRWQLLWKLRLPNSLPSFLTGAKIASGLSVIGGIVGEFFAGYGSGRFGLGYYVFQTSAQLKTAALFAAIISSTLLGWVAFGAVSLVGNRLLSRRRAG
jgi:NitT/TauT family transport system permease protein